LGGLIAAGWSAMPADLGPTRNAAGATHWGGWTLEGAFYLACGVAVVQSFRVMEAFFRHADARAMATLPTRLPALFGYRFLTALAETALLCLLALAFLVPAALAGAGRAFGAAAVLLVVAPLLIVSIGFAAQMVTGAAEYGRLPGLFTALDRQTGGPGGTGAAYMLAPAAGLGGSLFSLLLCKLTLDEVLRAASQGRDGLPGIATASAALLLAVVAVSLVWSARIFVREYPTLFARFFEADLYTVDVGYDYFARDRKAPRGLEARLSGSVATVYRLYRLQAARRRPFSRLLLWALPLAAALVFATRGAALEPWLIAAVGAGTLAFATNPWRALADPEIDPGMSRVLPIDQASWRSGRRWVLLREVTLATLPYSLCAVLLPDLSRVLAAALLFPLALASIPLGERLGRVRRARARLT
jgi:hypothetical protein